ncbi:MAG: hypothetical protein JJU41_03390 [Bacteroidetes bacterium]|nr:hypothetical protein [Bacteroidota bacterium]
MSNTTGSQRLSATVLMAIEIEYILDLHIKYLNTGLEIRHDPEKSVKDELLKKVFNSSESDMEQHINVNSGRLRFDADSNRKEKIRLLQSIKSFTEALESSGEDGSEILSKFRSSLDQSKSKPFEEFEFTIENLMEFYTNSIITNVKTGDLLSAFDELNTVAKIQFLNTVIGALGYTETGIDYLKETSTLSGELLEIPRIKGIIGDIGVKVDEDPNGVPVLNFADAELGEQFQRDIAASIPATNSAPVVSAFTLLSYFAKDVIPFVWMSLLYRSTVENDLTHGLTDSAQDIVNELFLLVLPASAIEAFNNATTDEDLAEEISKFETKLGTMVGLAFDALSIIAGAKSTIVIASSFNNEENISAEDVKKAVNAVNVITENVTKRLKTGSNRKLNGKRIGLGLGFIIVVIDIVIAGRNIHYAAIYGENMVIIGNLVVVSGSVMSFSLGAYMRVLSIAGGPKFWVASLIISTLALIGSALISRGQRSVYEQFADYCYFGTKGIIAATKNNEPDHVAYNFDHPDPQIALEEQINRMQTFLNPLNFSLKTGRYTFSVLFQPFREIDGVHHRWLQRSFTTHFDVGPIENGGSHEDFLDREDMRRLFSNGETSISRDNDEMDELVGKWYQMTAVIGEGDDQVKLLEYYKS